MSSVTHKVYGIKTNIGYYITSKENEVGVKSKCSSSHDIFKTDKCRINDELPKKSFRDSWYKLEKPLVKLEFQGSDLRVNERYEIKDRSTF